MFGLPVETTPRPECAFPSNHTRQRLSEQAAFDSHPSVIMPDLNIIEELFVPE